MKKRSCKQANTRRK